MKKRFSCRIGIHKYRHVKIEQFDLPSLGDRMTGEITTRSCVHCSKVKEQTGRLINNGLSADIVLEDLIAYREYEERQNEKV